MADYRSFSFTKMIGCWSCFGLINKQSRRRRTRRSIKNYLSQGLLTDGETECDEVSHSGDYTSNDTSGDDSEVQNLPNRSEDILNFRAENGMICRPFPAKETDKLVRSEDEDGNKMLNEYIREYKIGSGSYAKVALYQSSIDGRHYAIKSFHKSHLRKLRVAPSETAMTDVLREVLIMKMLEHPNIVNLIEVIDDPESDDFYMVLEYVEGKWVCEGSGRQCAIGEETARKYMRDIVSGLTYLHAHNIVHGDIKPDNLLITRNGTVKIGDFSVSQAFEDGNDELRRSPGTPVFTAPECCLGLTYHGKASDTWAVGVTLYCMILGEYPFLGDTLQDTYDRIVNNPIEIPDDINPQLKNLIEGLLCKGGLIIIWYTFCQLIYIEIPLKLSSPLTISQAMKLEKSICLLSSTFASSTLKSSSSSASSIAAPSSFWSPFSNFSSCCSFKYFFRASSLASYLSMTRANQVKLRVCQESVAFCVVWM